jgi:TRAP-type mannitol/chloroaromatic compound transport system permease large subunit
MERGFNQIWFAALLSVNLRMAFPTPPFGYPPFCLRGIAPPELTPFEGWCISYVCTGKPLFGQIHS